MPPSAARPAPVPPEPGAVSLDDAVARLEAALARFEALVEAGPLQSKLFRGDGDAGAPSARGPDGEAGLKVELDAARKRERALSAAAAQASRALGHAMDEVRHALQAGGEGADEDEADAPLDPQAATAEDSRP